jgi:hypothetical protein
LLPVRALDHEVLASGRGKTIVTSPAVCGGNLPLSREKLASFEAVEGRVKRTVVDG